MSKPLTTLLLHKQKAKDLDNTLTKTPLRQENMRTGNAEVWTGPLAQSRREQLISVISAMSAMESLPPEMAASHADSASGNSCRGSDPATTLDNCMLQDGQDQ